MLNPKKKISKREIKEDELLKIYVKASSFYYANKRYVSYAVTGLIIVIVATLIFINNRRAGNEKAATELGKVFPIYDLGSSNPAQYQQAIDGAPDRGIMGLKTIVDNYGSTESGMLARFYLASSYYCTGKYDDALNQFESFSSSNKLLQSSAYAGAGACLEAKGEYEKAGESYEKAAGAASSELTAPDYLNSAARCYGQGGKRDKAVELLKRLKLDYPTSQFARDADRYLSEFSA